MSRENARRLSVSRAFVWAALPLALALPLAGCGGPSDPAPAPATPTDSAASVSSSLGAPAASPGDKGKVPAASESRADALRAGLGIVEMYHDDEFVRGEKPARFQKYIVMHDTESAGDAASVVEWWVGSGNHVSAHFVVNRDGSIVQCVALDKICHHAGYGDTGHNERFGVTDESRDDKLGTTPIGDWAADYGMNSYSIGIEMVHVGDGSGYPEEQLRAVDGLIAYIDATYGFESEIIDHKSWRTGNSDCSAEFEPYLANLRATRTHDGSVRSGA